MNKHVLCVCLCDISRYYADLCERQHFSTVFVQAEELADRVRKLGSKGDIDPAENVANQRIYMFSGKLDVTIQTGVMEATEKWYRELNVPKANIKTEFDMTAGHLWPTDDYGGSCLGGGPPYIGDCGYDGSGIMLKHVMPGNYVARGKPKHSSNLMKIDQERFIPGGKSPRTAQVGEEGYVYVPDACKARTARCKLHIALHGCTQSAYAVGDKFVKNTGLNHWAETNNIVILYPQAELYLPSNPLGCWDYIASTNDDFHTKKGLQAGMIYNMVKHITSGQPAPGATVPAPPPVNPPNPPVNPPNSPVNPPVNPPGNSPVNPPVNSPTTSPSGNNNGNNNNNACNPACGQGQACANGVCIFVGQGDGNGAAVNNNGGNEDRLPQFRMEGGDDTLPSGDNSNTMVFVPPSGPSTGVIVAIVLGALVICAICVLLAVILVRRRNQEIDYTHSDVISMQNDFYTPTPAATQPVPSHNNTLHTSNSHDLPSPPTGGSIGPAYTLQRHQQQH